ncbi:isochorismatase family protein [Paenibacillus sp. DMB20]|uniref:isochorismatase family protein n=1 Tax=Paenibacillus sp. DMB20 TaxID=1642570 RepID=UPI0022862E49|nr:isochorismatase family protein [Paenibacillus sp. DMB20]
MGCNFPNCPRTTIYEASERDFKVVMVEDAVSGVYGKGIDEIKNIGVKVCATNEFMQVLGNMPPKG